MHYNPLTLPSVKHQERLQFSVVASDQGILPATDLRDEIILGPAERYEIIMSFSSLPDGAQVIVKNSEPTLIGPVEEGIDDQFMMFKVVGTSTPVPVVLPEWEFAHGTFDELFEELAAVSHPDVINQNILNNTVNKRELWITERTSVSALPQVAYGGRPLPMLGPRSKPFGQRYEDPITERPLQHKPTVWEFINLSADAHGKLEVVGTTPRCLYFSSNYSICSYSSPSGEIQDHRSP